MQKTYTEDKKLLLVQGVFWTLILNGFFYLLCRSPTPPEIRLSVSIVIILAGTFSYLRVRNRDYWVRLDVDHIEFCDSSKKILSTYGYSDIRRIDNFLGGFVLRLKKGSVRNVRVETSSFKNGRELKNELRKRWVKANM